MQGLSGFAFGMVSMSFWAWALDPRLAAALAVFGSLTGQLLAVFSVRRGFDWKMLWPFVAGGLAGVPLGVQLLPMLDMTWFKAVLGAILAIWCPTMLFAARLPRIKGNRVGDCAAGLVGGVMGGIGGFTGVVPLWCTLCGFDKHAQRRHPELQSVDAGGDHADLSGHGHDHARMLPMFAVVAPAMLVPTLLGTRLYMGISELAFRRIVLGLLTCSGVTLLISAVPCWRASAGQRPAAASAAPADTPARNPP